MSEGLMQFCVTHMAPRVWTGEDNCVYRASWKPSYPDPCNFEWMRFSFDVSEDEIATWVSRTHTTTDRFIHAAQDSDGGSET